MLDPPEEHGLCVPELFARQVRRAPDAIAVVFGDQQISYAELDARSDRFAARLRFLGVTAETVVGSCLERGVEAVVVLLAVLKAGGVYVPFDPRHPAERLELMLATPPGRAAPRRPPAGPRCADHRAVRWTVSGAGPADGLLDTGVDEFGLAEELRAAARAPLGPLEVQAELVGELGDAGRERAALAAIRRSSSSRQRRPASWGSSAIGRCGRCGSVMTRPQRRSSPSAPSVWRRRVDGLVAGDPAVDVDGLGRQLLGALGIEGVHRGSGTRSRTRTRARRRLRSRSRSRSRTGARRRPRSGSRRGLRPGPGRGLEAFAGVGLPGRPVRPCIPCAVACMRRVRAHPLPA
ncbi:AMP-binding protein [Streptomyces canarius]